MADEKQTTILVKRADGTTTEMTWKEFKEYQQRQLQNVSASTTVVDVDDTEDDLESEETEMKDELDNLSQEDKEIWDELEKEIESRVGKQEEEKEDFVPKKVKKDIPELKPKELEPSIKKEILPEYIEKKKDANVPMPQKTKGPLTVVTNSALSNTAPVKEIFKDEAVASSQKLSAASEKPVKKTEWSAEDHKSPLEEEMFTDKRHENLAKLPNKKEDEFGQVLRLLKFPVPDEMQQRLRSLVISRVKEIRSDDQVIGYAMRKSEIGGLGVNEQQAHEILSAIHQIIGKQKSDFFGPLPKQSSQVAGKSPLSAPAESKKNVQSHFGTGKPKIHDVVMPVITHAEEKKKSVGPVDELRTIGLVDFRRLAVDPMKASDILKEKFEVLKKESYLFFLEAMKAWHESPLYKQYQGIIYQAIEQGKHIDEVLAQQDNGQLRKEEFDALVKLSMNLH